MIFRTVPTDPDHNQDAEDDLFYRDTLQELVQVGATLARLVQTQAIADAQATVQGMAPSTPLADHAATFDRIARAIRRTITLARSLRDPVAPARAPAHPSAAARTPALHGAGMDAAGHPAAVAAAGREDAKVPNEAPSADLHDRRDAPERDRPERPDRDAPDRDDDDTGRPPAAIIADIRRDLGLDTPPGAATWTHGTLADLGQPYARAAAPSAAHQPGAEPHDPESGTVYHPKSQSPDSAALRAGPAPVATGSNPTDDPAETVAPVVQHPTHPPPPTTPAARSMVAGVGGGPVGPVRPCGIGMADSRISGAGSRQPEGECGRRAL